MLSLARFEQRYRAVPFGGERLVPTAVMSWHGSEHLSVATVPLATTPEDVPVTLM